MKKCKVLYWLLNITKGYRLTIILPLVLSVVSVVMSLVFVEILRVTVDGIGDDGVNLSLLVVIMILVRLLQLGCEEGETYFRGKVAAVLEYSYSLRAFSRLFNSKSRDVCAMHTGDEMSRLTTDVGVISQCVSYTIPIIIYAVVQLLFTALYLLNVKPELTFALIVIMPIMILGAKYYTHKLIPLSMEIRSQDAAVSSYIQEHLQRHEILSSLGVSRFVIQTVKGLQHKLYEKVKRQIKYDVTAEAFIDFGFVLGYLVVLVWGLWGIRDGQFSYAMLLVFLELVGQLERPFILMKTQYPVLINSLASAERLIELEELSEKESPENVQMHGALGVNCKSMTFSYDGDIKIFDNFSYDFKPNTVTAIIGETGAGKSTLIRLILSHLTPQQGHVYFYSEDDVQVEASAGTRCNCTYVPQGNSLISGTIRYNLLLGNLNASEEDMMKALHSSAADFVMSELPLGLDTVIGENGYGLSEGQAQRIAIARGLLHESSIILLDEPTSALDSETEVLLLNRLISRYKGKTILIVTHKKEIENYVNQVLLINGDK